MYEAEKEADPIETDETLTGLVEQYGSLVFSICYKITRHYFDAQDLTQETFLSAYRHLPSFDGNNPRAWLSRIATNKCLDYLKQASRKAEPALDCFFEAIPDSGPAAEEIVLETEIKNQLYDMCRRLKPPYDEVAVACFCQDRTVAELAAQRGKNPKTIRTQLYRAREMLKKQWRKE